MSRFLKLTSLVINTHHITSIKHNNSKYLISLREPDINGVLFFGTGHLFTNNTEYSFCSKYEETDYKTIQQWINTLDSNFLKYEENGN
jgi:hypothetical protein